MGLGDWLGGLFGTNNNYNATAPVNAYQASDNGASAQIGGAYANAQNNYGQQQNYINMLQQQASGQGGPSVAAQLLQQQTQSNNQGAASLVASQRGLNPALAARMGLNAQAMNNQASAQSGALLRSQEQLQSQGLLGQALGQQGSQNLQLLGQANQASQGAQQINAGIAGQNAQLQLGAEQINAGVASQNATTDAGLVGGLLGGLSSGGAQAMSSAKQMAQGGMVDDHLKHIQTGLQIYGQYQKLFGNSPGASSGAASGGASAGSAGAAAGDAGAAAGEGVGDAAAGAGEAVGDAAAGAGAAVGDAGAAAGEAIGTAVADGIAAMAASKGGTVPGQAKVAGNSFKNDTVPAELSPGEIVVPRSITQGPNAGERAKKFVEQLLARKGQGKSHFADGGEVDAGMDAIDGLPDVVTRTADKDKLDLWQWLKPGADSKRSGTAPPLPDGLESLNVGLPPGQGDPFAQPQPDAAQGVPEMLAQPIAMQPPASTPPMQQASQGVPPMLARPGNDPSVSLIGQGARQQQKGIADTGAARAAGLKDLAKVQDAAATKSQQMADQSMVDVKDRIAEQDQRAKAIVDVNPNRYWNNLTTSGKIANTIALVLGGIGSGLTHGPNMALDRLHGAIKDDIDAQKINIGKKENELSRYMESTKDLQAAQHMVAAQHWATVGAQVAAAQAKAGGQASLPEAAALIGAAKQQQAIETQQAQERSLQLRQGELQMTMAQRQMQFLQNARASKDPNALAIAGKEIEYLQHPEKRGAEQVDVPEVRTVGTDAQGNAHTKIESVPYYGKSEAHASEAAKAMIRQRNIETSLGELEHFTKTNPLGGVPGALSVGKARAAAATLKTNLEGTLADMNRPASPETMKQMDEIVGDPAAFLKSPSKYEGMLKFARQIANDHKQAVIDAHTLGPMP